MAGAALLVLFAGASGAEHFQDFDQWQSASPWGIYTDTNGWTLYNGRVEPLRGWRPPYSSPHSGWLHDSDVATNSWLESPPLPYGAGTLSFLCRAFRPQDTNVFEVQSLSTNGAWTSILTFTNRSEAWTPHTNAIQSFDSRGLRIVKTGDLPGSESYLGFDDVRIVLPPGVILSGLTHAPAAPTVEDTVHVSVETVPGPHASNVVLSTMYRSGTGEPFRRIPMAGTTGNSYRTATPIPRGFAQTVSYYVECSYDGAGPSPVFIPEAGSNAPASYTPAGLYSSVTRQLGPASRFTPLIFSEIMYHPGPDDPQENLEYVELFNTEHVSHDVGQFRISGAAEFTFPPGTVLPGRSFLVIARDPDALRDHHSIGNVLGPLTGALSNGGGVLSLMNRIGAELLEARYSDDPPWPAAADGAGHSLVLACPDHGPALPEAWTASAYAGGSPGMPDPDPADPLDAVVINEFLAHTDPPAHDFLELYNAGTNVIDLSGCFVSDQPGTNGYRMPPGSTMEPFGFLSLNTNSVDLGFGLSPSGEALYLVDSNGTRVLDAVRYEAQENGIATGRFPDGSPTFHELSAPTEGTTNAPLLIRSVVINEIMYHPISDRAEYEYVELHNRSPVPVDVGHWAFVNGIDFTIPAGTVIPARGYLIVAKDAHWLTTRYADRLGPTNTVGNFGGRLSNRGERIALAKPDDPTHPLQDFVIVDEVTYGDGETWGEWADGGGSSLELTDPRADNRLAANWAGSDETRKDTNLWTLIEHTGPLRLGGMAEPTELHLMLLDPGECLIDNIEVVKNDGPNLIANGTFENGLGGYAIRGNHSGSALEANEGFEGGQSLHIRATGDGDNGANCIEVDFSGLVRSDTNVTIRARARWLRGHPGILLRLLGNWLEAPALLDVPRRLGTPGLPNSCLRTNAPPAVSDVSHSPILPAASRDVLVTARVHDPDGISSVLLKYRVDPATTPNAVVMNDSGADGDALPNDGLYTGRIPGQSGNVLVAFHVEATDSHSPPATSRFPREAPAREGLVLFGQTPPPGGFGTYRFWITAATRQQWTAQPRLSNLLLDATLVYNGFRVIYNAGVRYRGSPWIRPGGDPVSVNSAYVFKAPKDDRLLDTRSFNLDAFEFGRDPTYQRERTCFWIADRLGVPSSNQRFCHVYLNATKKGTVFGDTAHPNRDFLSVWAPGESEGELFEIDDWFEFNDSMGRLGNVNATLWDYNVTGAKTPAVYRWSWEKKPAGASDISYASLLQLVDAMNLPLGELYDRRVRALVDYDNWMRILAVRHIGADWDGYGYERGKNTYAYKPPDGPWKLFLWDLDFALGAQSRSASASMFESINDQVLRNDPGFFQHPRFRRAYFQAMRDAVDGPLLPQNCGRMMDELHAAFLANAVPAASPDGVKSWIATRRSSMLTELAPTAATFGITTADGITTQRIVNLTGTAPPEVTALRLNGIEHCPYFSSVTAWSLPVGLSPGTNRLTAEAYDRYGEAAGSDTVTITLEAESVSPAGRLVISEIMYGPARANAEFIEIHNASERHAFDMTGWELGGVDFIFPGGSIIGPSEYKVVVEDIEAYAAAYTNVEPVLGAYEGSLDNGGETLRLRMPAGSNAWLTVDEVRYDDDPPWPVWADGYGPSLQLIDPSADNNRVGNWAAVSLEANRDWTFAQMTGTSTDNVRTLGDAAVHVALGEAGEVHVDDISLVAGPVHGAGTNIVRNGGFESALHGTWTAEGTHAAGEVTTEARFTGLQSLWLTASGRGDTQGNSVRQGALGLDLSTVYTLSYWYLPSSTATSLTVQVTETDIVSAHRALPEPPEDPLFTPGLPNSVASTLPGLPRVWINEVMPDNRTVIADNEGEFEPWIELYNAETGSIHLAQDGYFLTDDPLDLTKWVFPTGSVIGAGGRMLVWADGETNETAPGFAHAGFAMGAETGQVVLAMESAGRPVVLDWMRYSRITADYSYGCYPEDDPYSRQVFHHPTPGLPNSPTSAPIAVTFNEWMAWNSRTIRDPTDGQYDDWFELHNASPAPFDLGGCTLTDDPTDTNQFTIPGGTVIGGRRFMLVWADNDDETNAPGTPLHVNFRLSASGEAIALYAPDGSPVDSVVFGPQSQDVSEGRWPDGSGGIYRMQTPTPGESNVVFRFTAALESDADSASLAWSSVSGSVYTVEFAQDLVGSNWVHLCVVTADSETVLFVDTNMTGVTRRFYRILEAD
ncbi:lamin tail domain-containing protein [Verrucomicrobiota bacterium]